MAEERTFRMHASSIVSDPNLSAEQKKTQMMYLIRSLNVEELYDFFSDKLSADNLWLFEMGKINHFNNFVQQFQMETEKMKIVDLTTAVPLDPVDVEAIAADLAKAFASKVLINHEVNPAIIGGAQVHIDNLVYDLSLRSKFQQFEREWVSSINQTGKLTGRYDQFA